MESDRNMTSHGIKGIVHGKTIVLERDLGLPDGQEVKVEIQAARVDSPDAILALAAQVFDGLSEADIVEIEGAHFRRREFFGTREQ